jgi:small subunit ribosomal protein S5
MPYYNAESEFEEKIVQVNRVSKKTAGGNKIGFSVLAVVGDRAGRVGVGLGKAPSVQEAIRKGSTYAKKHLLTVPMVETTIPHEIFIKRGAAKVLLKPAAKGTGVIAGGAVRAVVEAAGIKDILSKVLGTSNQASNVYATLEALGQLRPLKEKGSQPKVKVEVEAKIEKEEKETVSTKKQVVRKRKTEIPSENKSELKKGTKK